MDQRKQSDNLNQAASGPSTCVFTDTMAEMTYKEVEASIRGGAVGLWAMGVIEQHGPHLPTGTDVYIPGARLRAVKTLLAQSGVEALIIPPFYWGVNFVSASFPASIKVRAEVMIELLTDVMKSLGQDGMRRMFLISGHNDRAHNQAIVAAVRKGRLESGLQPWFVCDRAVAERLGHGPEDPDVLPFETPPEPHGVYLDIHAGEVETSIMLGCNPALVRRETLAELKPTNLQASDLAQWRHGHETARQVTPQGYFGAPASATAQRGAALLENEARAIAEVIRRQVQGA
ncbi:Creatinine amidohydrolase [Castellaniella defragrans]